MSELRRTADEVDARPAVRLWAASEQRVERATAAIVVVTVMRV